MKPLQNLAPQEKGARNPALVDASIKGVVRGIKGFRKLSFSRYVVLETGEYMTSIAYKTDHPSSLCSSVVFASPHSGRNYPETFLKQSVLDEKSIRSSEDAFVDQLFNSVTEFGAPLLKAVAPRAYVDLNRAAGELDPALIVGVRSLGNNPRVSSGLGVIPRVVANGRAIYRGKIRMEEAAERIDTYWRPYHNALKTLLQDAYTHFGEAILIDCHSMPREALDSLRPRGGKRPEIVLGDRFGASSAPHIVEQIEAAFASAGFNVSRNSPFAGAYITQQYGRPGRNQHAIQVEIDRSLYMNEAAVAPNADFEDFKRRLRGVISELAAIGRPEQSLAAE